MPGDSSNVSLLMQGIGQLGQASQAYAQDQAKNRQLHPSLQKYLDEVLNGNMTPKQAAVLAKLETQGGGLSAPNIQPQGPMEMTSGAPAQFAGMAPGSEGGLSPEAMQMAARPPSPMPLSGGGQNRVNPIAAPPQRSLMDMRASAPQRPYTAQDLQDVSELAPLMRARGGAGGVTQEQWLEREKERRNTATARESAKQETNKQRYDAQDKALTRRQEFMSTIEQRRQEGKDISREDEQKFREEQLAQQHLNRMAQIKEQARLMAQQGATKQQWERLKMVAELEKAKLSSLTALRGSRSQLAGDEDVMRMGKELEDEIRDLDLEIREAIITGREGASDQEAAPRQPQQQAPQRKFFQGKWWIRGPNGEAIPEGG